jgi:hypothetical protein
VGCVVRRTGWQAKATMHALLNDRVVQRPERIVGGTHKTEEKSVGGQWPAAMAVKVTDQKSFRDEGFLEGRKRASVPG